MHKHGVYLHTSIKESFSYSLLEAKLAGLTTCAYEKLEVPLEFVDIPIKNFNVDEWYNTILSMQKSKISFDKNKYTLKKMVKDTINLAK